MDFTQEVGRTLSLSVAAWVDPRGIEQVGFAAQFEDLDALLFSARTPEQRNRDERRMELDQWDYVPIDPWNSRRSDPDYGSIRTYQIQGEPPQPLVVHDQWEALVLSCTYNPTARLTKDGRRKIRYVVQPIQRIERVERRYLPDKKEMLFQIQCGSNCQNVLVPCSVRPAQFRLDANGDRFVKTEHIRCTFRGEAISCWGDHEIHRAEVSIAEQRELLGRHLDVRRVRRQLIALPVAPDDLLKQIAA